MKRSTLALALTTAGAGLVALASTGCSNAAAADPDPRQEAPVDLTVYRQDFGLVQEVRTVNLQVGTNQVRVTGVSGQLDPDSVMLQPEAGARVVSTTFDLGLGGDNSNLVQRFAGKNVEFIWASTDGKPGDRIKGHLEPSNDGTLLLRVGDQVFVNPQGTLVIPAEQGLGPGLSARVESKEARSGGMKVSYLTRGLSWDADYVAHLDTDAATMTLECWASVRNDTGISFPDAKVTFVAGNPNRAVEAPQPRSLPVNASAGYPNEKAGDAIEMNRARPQAIGELYRYEPVEASVGLNQINRVRMFGSGSIPVKLDYGVRLPEFYEAGASTKQRNAQLSVKFANQKDAGLGVQLPAGAVRIYEADNGIDRYTGAGSLADTPVNMPISLPVSNSFDVTTESKISSIKRLDKKTVQRTLHVLVRNAKAREVQVRLVQPIYNRYRLFGATKPSAQSANQIQWTITVPAKGEKVFETQIQTTE